MAVKVSVPFKKTVELAGSLDAAYTYFSKVEEAIPEHFPGLESLKSKGGDTYEWVFEKVKFSGQELQLKLLTRFEFTPGKAIVLHPVDPKAPATAEGSWLFAQKGNKTQVTFEMRLEAELPIPFFLKSVATPLAQKELTRFFDHYMDSISNVALA